MLYVWVKFFYESRESSVIGHVLLRDDTEMWNVPDLRVLNILHILLTLEPAN